MRLCGLESVLTRRMEGSKGKEKMPHRGHALLRTLRGNIFRASLSERSNLVHGTTLV